MLRYASRRSLSCGLGVILCVGETLEVREAGDAVASVEAQLDASLPRTLAGEADFAIAYEPIWAIGSGKVPTAAEIFAVANVDGALVGGASLKAADFMPIVAAAAAAR